MPVQTVMPSPTRRQRRNRARRLRNLSPPIPGQIRNLRPTQRAKTISPTLGKSRFAGRELLDIATVTAGGVVKSYSLSPGATTAPRLDAFAGIYESYRWLKCRIVAQPVVGTTEPGQFAIGVDFKSSTVPSTFGAVAGLLPAAFGAVWQERAVTVPPSQLNLQNWLRVQDTESAVAYLAIQGMSTTATSGVAVWLEYDLEFMSPTNAPVARGLSTAGYFINPGTSNVLTGTTYATSSSPVHIVSVSGVIGPSVSLLISNDTSVSQPVFIAVAAQPPFTALMSLPPGNTTVQVPPPLDETESASASVLVLSSLTFQS